MNSTPDIVTDARPAGTPAVRSGTLLADDKCENNRLTIRTSSHIFRTYEKHDLDGTIRNHGLLLRPIRGTRRQEVCGVSRLRRSRNPSTMETRRCRHAQHNSNAHIGLAKPRQRTGGADSKANLGARESEARMKCPKCGHQFKAENQAKGGKARWRGMSKTERKQAASAAAKARWAKSANP